MANEKIDWLMAKNDYINTNMSYRDLATKYNVSHQSVSKHGKEEGWVDLKKKKLTEISTKVEQITTKKTIEIEADRITTLLNLTDTAQDKISEAFEQLTTYVDMFGNVHESEVIDVAKLKKLISALKEIKEILAVDRVSTSENDKKQIDLLSAIQRAVRNDN